MFRSCCMQSSSSKIIKTDLESRRLQKTPCIQSTAFVWRNFTFLWPAIFVMCPDVCHLFVWTVQNRVGWVLICSPLRRIDPQPLLLSYMAIEGVTSKPVAMPSHVTPSWCWHVFFCAAEDFRPCSTAIRQEGIPPVSSSQITGCIFAFS